MPNGLVVGFGSAEEAHHTLLTLIWQDLGVADPRVVIDADVHELPASAAILNRPAARTTTSASHLRRTLGMVFLLPRQYGRAARTRDLGRLSEGTS